MCSDRVRVRGRAVAALAAGVWIAAAAAAAEPPAFSGHRAFAWIDRQCDLGPRPPGSAALETLRRLVEAHADSLGLPVARLCFTARDPWRGGDVTLCNLVVSCGPAGGDRLWLGAHYDTRPACDQDPDPARRGEPLLGANDGASGTAILLHLMEVLAAAPPARGVDLIFFDGEDSGRSGDPRGFCLGSRHLAATWRDFPSPLAGGKPRALIVLDMVGERGLRIGKEGYSQAYAPELTSLVFARAASLRLTALVPEPATAVYDDHVPFLEAGIPAVDLIDFEFPQWHTAGDVPAVCDPASLTQVGRLVLSLCREPLPGF
ncbi:MAG TPA: M28 family peptidase [Candidatus Krumholzibacteria bacterium]|nr:M28 family peptidase [Candidatus Krumholzibacteria bacterium]HPD71305.1 M28 family peptidase [Candidatus Krumholzibacteria bacterium]HRY38995.1 M28 family peptidase [Candidatus Krumholzibacteria bacterium]